MNMQEKTISAASSIKWHSVTPAAALSGLASTDEGLANEDVVKRRNAIGRNELRSAPPTSAITRSLRPLNNTLICFLIAAAIAAAFLSHVVDAIVIIAVVVVNSIVGFVALVILQLAMTYLPALKAGLGTEALSFSNLIVVVLVGVFLMTVLEFEKAIMRRLGLLRQEI